MAKVGDWMKEAAAMSDRELLKRVEALKALIAWPLFNTEYEGFGIGTVLAVTNGELRGRMKAAVAAESEGAK